MKALLPALVLATVTAWGCTGAARTNLTRLGTSTADVIARPSTVSSNADAHGGEFRAAARFWFHVVEGVGKVGHAESLPAREPGR